MLRAHVPPPLLAELAAAASADTNEGAAREVLSDVPSVGRWLDRTAKRSRPRQAGAVAHLLAELPLDPGYVLQVRTLGGLAVSRSDGRELGPEWGRRRRVQDLFVYLLAHQRPTRKAAAAALWPSLSEAKAAANLRVNLTHLHAALEPGRQPGARPYFIDATSTDLRLIRDSIEIDTDQFDRHIAEASAAEADGVPTSALEHYAAASDLYRGWYLPLVEEEWVVPERLRLHSLAHAAICRTGELTLARGRPEQAIVSAVQAQQLDSMSERAHRLSIRCHLALGSESSARIAARGLIAQLHDDGLRPDIETQRLLSRLGVA
ncbi:MAG: bacterial transcriptional activator domain-containing protein [Acidimicrobiales bacterium]